ncbi:MAG: PIN domain-containing protein [Gemmatimonadales bacterium]|nr:PIN domain-containing protein [Gemmatimonadales bacterium]
MLLDTGPLVACLDARDQWHTACVEAWPEVLDRCVTTEAVVTEASHFVGRGGGPAVLALEFLLAARIPIVPLDPPAHRQASHLMRRYARVPMDYADATLVVLGDALDAPRVFTLDRRGFRAYRGARGLALEIVPVALT